ncbi:hypothetical protein N9R43_01720 [bacterium]|nr:hypothetical protein [bacterium]
MIPEQLECKTHLLEYMPGTYGDFVSGIISYSVDGFIDPCDPTLSDNERYWNAPTGIVSRNKYPLSLRGSGHEHVEWYTEFMLAHHVFLHYNPILNMNDQDQHQLLFNTHTYIVDSTKFRTTNNKFTRTQTKCLTIKDDFDIILKSVCNEYFTSHPNYNDINWDNFRTMFINRVTKVREIDKLIPKDQIVEIEHIEDFSQDLISCYGKVDTNRFDVYLDEYKQLKLNYFLRLFNRTNKVHFKANSDRLNTYARYYDRINP